MWFRNLYLQAQVKKVGINMKAKRGIFVALVMLVMAPWSIAFAELPVFTLTFKQDGTIDPKRLDVPAGRFKLILVNESSEAVEFESLPLRTEKVLGPGVTSFVVMTLSRPGEYPFFDDFHPKIKGVLVVHAPSK